MPIPVCENWDGVCVCGGGGGGNGLKCTQLGAICTFLNAVVLFS